MKFNNEFNSNAYIKKTWGLPFIAIIKILKFEFAQIFHKDIEKKSSLNEKCWNKNYDKPFFFVFDINLHP